MSDVMIRVENLSKEYRLGTISHGTLQRDLQSWWARIRGREDPNSIISAPRGLAINSPRSTDSGNPHFLALNDVSFEVRKGEVLGIIGRNGAGKSTLLKILSKVTAPTRGVVKIKGRIASLLEVGTGFHPELTGRENVYLNGAILGMTKKEIASKFDEIVAFSEIGRFIDTPSKRYSSGMYVRLAFAVAAHLEPEILIIDEVLAVGDMAFQKKCLGKIGDVAKGGRTVLFVSHNMNMIEALCNKSIFLQEGNAKGPVSIKEGIALYLGQAGLNKKSFGDKPLKNAYVRQMKDQIEIYAEYDLERDITIPCLGFVISDYFGNPICGSNPLLDPAVQFPATGRSGMAKVVIEQPKLLNGTYRLSLWFGDGREVFFIEKDCLTFDIVNMAVDRQPAASDVGPVCPKCTWTFFSEKKLY
jgi:lipopolysaccharide transport system ATP-binding protein